MDDYWLVIRVEPSYRPFVVNVPFRSEQAADEAWGGLAPGYGFKEALVVRAESHSDATSEAQKLVRRIDICDSGLDESEIDTRPLSQLRKEN